ncbi:MAG: hypothetical protein J6D52_12180 [Clostridia bacterium]|nr:hypothetical protein [Clostridia bacterium]
MCIAITSPIGTDIPNDDILRTCFRNNDNGAGIAFNTDNNQVQIVKGFMDFESFITALHKYDEKYCFKNRGVLLHFRISTHGGTNPSNTHPFPISSNSKHLKKTRFVSNYACIHNGIINLTADRKSELSDTMLFVKDYLSKISSNRGWFHNPKNIELIEMLIDSKMAILNGNGEIISTSGFHKAEDGNYYSNTSYKTSYFSLYDFGFYSSWFDNEIEIENEKLECPLMKLKKNEIVFYEDGRTEEYEGGYHNIYPLYITKEGDIYSDYADSITNGKVLMENLNYLGNGYIVSQKSPMKIIEFRKDIVGYI